MDLIATAMVSSLGYDSVTACAAARGGLSRAADLPFVVVENDGSPTLAVGHCAGLLTSGFEGDARLVRLLEGALRDLLGQIPGDLVEGPRVSYYLAIPAQDRERQGLDLLEDDEARISYLEELDEPADVNEVERGRTILRTALRIAGVPRASADVVNCVQISVSGHAAAIELYERAAQDMASGMADVAIVAGVDSLLGSATLAWLHRLRRLKDAESPAGLSPGEAAAVVAFSRTDVSRYLSKPSCSCVGRVATAGSSTQFLHGDQGDGAAQFTVLKNLTEGLGSDAYRWLIVDQNGEVFRATDWGRTIVRQRAADPVFDGVASMWYPAGSFGDIGVASGLVATCMAAQAYERGYAPSSHAIIMTNSDGPQRSGCVVSRIGS